MIENAALKKKTPLKTLGQGIAGALAIASGTSAYANIVFVNPPVDLTNVPGGTNTSANWDVNSDGIADFFFQNRFPNTPPENNGVVWQLNMDPAAGTASTNGLLSYAGSNVRYAFALGVYRVIGSSRPGFSTQTQVTLGSQYHYGSAEPNYYGGFAASLGYLGQGYFSVAPGTFAFVGFRFHAADGTHYGWIRLSVNAGIIDFDTAAYNTSPNQEIATVPEPGTLALLAFGAVGVIGAIARRRQG